MTKWAWFAVVWLALVVPIFAALYVMADGPNFRRLANDNRVAEGIVVSVDPGNHASARIQFSDGAKSYESTVYRCDCDPGDRRLIYYHPPDPALASVDSPKRHLGSSISIIILASAVFAAAAAHYLLKATEFLGPLT